MTALLLAEHDGTAISAQTARALAAALRIETEVDVLVAGVDCAGAAAAAARLSGVAKVLLADAPSLAHGMAEPLAALLVALADGYDALLAPATSVGKGVMPRVAALLDVMQVSEIIEVVAPDTFRRPIYAGNAVETVRIPSGKRVATIRSSAFQPVGQQEAVSIASVTVPEVEPLSRFLGSEIASSDLPELASADIVISGGRGLGSAANFETLLLPIARQLGAAIGASRAAVDAGFAGNDLQVGQTGKIVAPSLYIACGISGAIQHLAGMKDAGVIVAINKDADAPIFQIADYGLVADLFEALPEFLRLLGPTAGGSHAG